MTYTIYRDGYVAHTGATFNHATGALYRSQLFGMSGQPGHRNVFDVQRDLYAGHTVRIGNVIAVPEVTPR